MKVAGQSRDTVLLPAADVGATTAVPLIAADSCGVPAGAPIAAIGCAVRFHYAAKRRKFSSGCSAGRAAVAIVVQWECSSRRQASSSITISEVTRFYAITLGARQGGGRN
jgi:hypothetical protein